MNKSNIEFIESQEIQAFMINGLNIVKKIISKASIRTSDRTEIINGILSDIERVKSFGNIKNDNMRIYEISHSTICLINKYFNNIRKQDIHSIILPLILFNGISKFSLLYQIDINENDDSDEYYKSMLDTLLKYIEKSFVEVDAITNNITMNMFTTTYNLTNPRPITISSIQKRL